MSELNPIPVGLLVYCCDVHVDCAVAPPNAVHRFMDADARRKNKTAAMAALRVMHLGDPSVDPRESL